MPANDAYVPLKAIAGMLRLDTGTVRNWRYRGWLTPSGERRYVRVQDRRYCAADVIAAERDTRLSSQSRRGLRPVAA